MLILLLFSLGYLFNSNLYSAATINYSSTVDGAPTTSAVTYTHNPYYRDSTKQVIPQSAQALPPEGDQQKFPSGEHLIKINPPDCINPLDCIKQQLEALGYVGVTVNHAKNMLFYKNNYGCVVEFFLSNYIDCQMTTSARRNDPSSANRATAESGPIPFSLPDKWPNLEQERLV